ncbi:hypothetical protein HK104_003694 [Borealophlyctis nickersoniae]|nr:hypothetical protein HK104_003694 [Borealophlyctis nickersoniae]
MKVALLPVLALASAAWAEQQQNPIEGESPAAASAVTFKPTTIKAPFLEQFDENWEKRWIPSEAKKVVDGVEDEELLRYRGEWAVEEPAVSVISGDEGLVLKTAAAHHAIAAKFDKPVDPKGKPLVVQYEVALQNGLECGGAYMKLLTFNESETFVPRNFDDKTPYTIMFGPDKCGFTNKVHFIFRHKNPKTGVIEEKHLTSPPAARVTKQTNLYTLIVRPDQTFDILINSESVKKGSLLEDFTPAVNPPKKIDDPEDKKPEDWVDIQKIPDPEAKKPEDWDEEAPFEIPDEDAEKPADWLDDEPLTIPDPDAEKPEDWNDEEDGEWVPPTVPNPKCEASGCGEWKRPMKKNPKYKGKWSAPLIDNPAYKGEWKPRQIDNPDFFEDKTPADFNKIGAIGFELWTMQNGILFDNIYVGHSEADAKKLAAETYEIKAKIESEKTESETEKAKDSEKPATASDSKVENIVENVKDQVLDFIGRVQVDPLQAVKELPLVAGGLAAAVLLPVLLLASLLGGSSAKPVVKKVKQVKSKVEKKVETSDGDEAEVVKDPKGTGSAQKRTVRKGDADDE